MQKSLHYTLLLFVFSCSLFAQTSKKVLFLGNSYTGVNNLPLLVQQMATATQDVLTYDSHTPGGATLMNHSTNPAVANKINANQWDYVVLQEQSQIPSFPTSQIEQIMYPYATSLCDLIRQNYTCSVPLFYNTWGRKNGDATNCPIHPPVCTYEGMDNLLQERYRTMAEQNNGVIAPVASVWRSLRANHPDIELYSADESHPSLVGSMAAAYTFYTIIFQKDPTLITFNANLNTEVANTIKNTVKNVVFNQLEEWLSDVNDNFAYFTFNHINSGEIHFENNTVGATDFIWNFGNGDTATEQNPTYTFTENGVYNVSLTLTICGKTYTKTRTITVNNLSNNIAEKPKINLYPNPVDNFLFIEGSNPINKLKIIDLLGKTKLEFDNINQKNFSINTTSLSKGVYFVLLISENGTMMQKIIK